MTLRVTATGGRESARDVGVEREEQEQREGDAPDDRGEQVDDREDHADRLADRVVGDGAAAREVGVALDLCGEGESEVGRR